MDPFYWLAMLERVGRWAYRGFIVWLLVGGVAYAIWVMTDDPWREVLPVARGIADLVTFGRWDLVLPAQLLTLLAIGYILWRVIFWSMYR